MSKLIGGGDYESGSRMAAGQTATGVREAKDYTTQALGQISPYQKVGTEALDMYKNMVLGGDMSQFQASPGYQFRLGEGIKELEKRGSAMGTTLSGSQLKGIQDYAQNLASQEYGNYLGQLGGLAGQGLQAGGQGASILAGTGSNILGAYSNLGQTQAQMAGMKGQAKGQFFSDLMGAGALGAGAYFGGRK
jgi:hypothetical protein